MNNLDQCPEDELADALKALIEAIEIDDPKHIGIAKQVIAEGIKSLSEKQRYVFITYIAPSLDRKCEGNGCDAIIPISRNPECFAERTGRVVR